MLCYTVLCCAVLCCAVLLNAGYVTCKTVQAFMPTPILSWCYWKLAVTETSNVAFSCAFVDALLVRIWSQLGANNRSQSKDACS